MALCNLAGFGSDGNKQKYTKEDTQGKLDSQNACYHPEENILPSCSLCGNMKIKIQGTIAVPVVPYGYKTWPLALNEGHNL